MRILVTGSEGYIGQHLLVHLAGTTHKVRTVDRRLGADYQRDVRDGLADVLDSFKPDRVIHLAATVGVVHCDSHPTEALVNNVYTTEALAQACGKRGIKLVYASTSEAYSADGDWTEEDRLPPPRNVYGMTKRWGEDIAHLYADDPIVLRLTMPYGPGAPPGVNRRSLDNFLWWAYHRQPITVHEGAERCWVWVEDLVRGMMTVVEQADSGTWNVGRDDDYVPMLDLARRCCRVAGANPDDLITVVPLPANRTAHKRLVTAKLQALGWRPTVELDEGLPLMMDWIRRFDVNGNYLDGRAA
jgi:nucleoside-diphosphate-sugar epimerase